MKAHTDDLSPLRPCADAGAARGRDLLLRHAADAPHPLAPPQGSRPRARRDRACRSPTGTAARASPTALAAFLPMPRFSRASRGALVIVLSDGLERGDAEPMAHAVRRLAARSWRLAWLTPLAADPAFRPETAALKAILPIVDHLGDGSGIAPLCDFIEASGRLGARPPAAGRQWRKRHDQRPSSTPIITSGGRPTCPGSSGRWCRASSGPMSRSAATIRSRNTSPTSPAPAS